MARLSTIRSKVATLPSLFARQSDDREVLAPWRKWYHLARWTSKPNGLRWQALARDMFKCRRCGYAPSRTSDLVADHIIPHKGDPALFWSQANLQCLCINCHSSAKQREERRGG